MRGSAVRCSACCGNSDAGPRRHRGLETQVSARSKFARAGRRAVADRIGQMLPAARRARPRSRRGCSPARSAPRLSRVLVRITWLTVCAPIVTSGSRRASRARPRSCTARRRTPPCRLMARAQVAHRMAQFVLGSSRAQPAVDVSKTSRFSAACGNRTSGPARRSRSPISSFSAITASSASHHNSPIRSAKLVAT